MTNPEAYNQAINAIIADKINVFGPQAISTAQSADGVTIDDDGKVVSISGSPKEAVHNILIAFESIGGKISTMLARTSVYSVLQKYPDLDLPDELK